MLSLVCFTACSPAYYTLPPYPPPPKKQASVPSYPSTRPATKGPEVQSAGPVETYSQPSSTAGGPRVPEEKSPQRIASAELVDRARNLALSGQVDEALGLLERAIEIDAYNGEAFYEMARCWELKGNHNRALTFVDRAILIFEGRPERLKKAYLLKSEILMRLGRTEEAHRLRSMAQSE